MIKRLTILLLLSYSAVAYAQYDIIMQYRRADSLLQADNALEAYKILRRIEPVTNKKDTSLYPHVIFDYTVAVSMLEADARMNENWKFSISYALEALGVIKKGKEYFEGEYAEREYWMYKNIIVAYFGLGYPEKAREYQDKLYLAYKMHKLPAGLDEYYNFEFFKWNGLHVWAYEWYPELADMKENDGYSKIVYYVYNTNPDGTDKDQLYRIHVQKLTKADATIKPDYVLNKQLETATGETSGFLYAYTYRSPINYNKLRADIRQVLKGIYEPPVIAPVKKPAPKTTKAPVKKKK
jgi:hypothetical protein